MNQLFLNKNTAVLLLASTIGIGFFLAGVADVLSYFIIKLLLFGGFMLLLFLTIFSGLNNESKKIRPDDASQDELN